MKTDAAFSIRSGRMGFLAVLLLATLMPRLDAQTSQPAITSIRQEGTNLVIVAEVPDGVRRVTLEGRARLGAGAWEPRAVARPDGSGGAVTFRLACSRSLELLRVRADATESLPASFFSGTNSFVGEPGNENGSLVPTAFGGTRGDGASLNTPAEPSREVVESDIWRLQGDTLYFFNQYRGLQIIQLADPDAPVISGTLALPASGEQMYLLGADRVVLLARNGCYYGAGQESQVLVVADQNGIPAVTARLPVAGHILESRLVGTALYVASQMYRQRFGTNGATTVYEWGTLVSAFDLATPDAPVSRGTLWFPGYGNVVSATDRFLFVVTQDPANGWNSVAQIVDISAPDGTMQARGAVRSAGRITDKFKLNVSGDVLTVISQIQSNTFNTNVFTRLETFSLADAAVPAKLGELELGRSETLHATRFDGDRVYVVTFHVQFRIDPLWVVDLSDPTRPTVKGELEIPGWSTFLQPLGDRLVALGIETNRTTVSLFDVAHPEQPALLSRVALGAGWSWSEANWDEQAFNVLAEDGLILVPFQTWTTNGHVQQVQLIDLHADSLAARGVVEHQVTPRRATVYGDRILSLSGHELLTVDAADRDHPVVRHRLDLAWPVDRVFVQGDYLLELSTALRSWGWWDWWSWENPVPPVVRVTPADEPDRVLTTLELTKLPVLGATRQGDHLYLAQGPAGWFYSWIYVTSADEKVEAESKFVLTVIDLSRLPELAIVGQVAVTNNHQFWGSNLQPLWVRPGLLVWDTGDQGGWGWYRPIPIPIAMAMPVGGLLMTDALIAPWPWWFSGNTRLLAFDVGNPAAPRFVSEVDLGQNNHWRSYGRAFTAEGLVYLSHQRSEFVPGLDTPWKTAGYTNVYHDETTGEYTTNSLPMGSWTQRYFLDAVDYADAAHPTVRDPVNISGTLAGVSHAGALLYTRSVQWTRGTNGLIQWTEQLDALAYDGVAAHLVDSLPLPNHWPQPLLVLGNDLFLGRPGYDYTTTNRYPHTLETWTVPDTGKFTRLGSVTLTAPASVLQEFPGLLAVQESDSAITLFGRTNPAALEGLGRSQPNACYWFDLANGGGDATRGLWLPQGGFGVGRVPIGP